MRATDTKLKRDVALKILPESFAQDPQRMGCFQREAEVLASLDHPKPDTKLSGECRAPIHSQYPETGSLHSGGHPTHS